MQTINLAFNSRSKLAITGFLSHLKIAAGGHAALSTGFHSERAGINT
jgi:hypothetical protein